MSKGVYFLAIIRTVYNIILSLLQITCAPLFKKGDTFMRFPNGARYSRWWMQKFLPEGLINDMHTFCNQLHECCPSDTEIAIVCAIRLTAPGKYAALPEILSCDSLTVWASCCIKTSDDIQSTRVRKNIIISGLSDHPVTIFY